MSKNIFNYFLLGIFCFFPFIVQADLTKEELGIVNDLLAKKIFSDDKKKIRDGVLNDKKEISAEKLKEWEKVVTDLINAKGVFAKPDDKIEYVKELFSAIFSSLEQFQTGVAEEDLGIIASAFLNLDIVQEIFKDFSSNEQSEVGDEKEPEESFEGPEKEVLKDKKNSMHKQKSPEKDKDKDKDKTPEPDKDSDKEEEQDDEEIAIDDLEFESVGDNPKMKDDEEELDDDEELEGEKEKNKGFFGLKEIPLSPGLGQLSTDQKKVFFLKNGAEVPIASTTTPVFTMQTDLIESQIVKFLKNYVENSQKSKRSKLRNSDIIKNYVDAPKSEEAFMGGIMKLQNDYQIQAKNNYKFQTMNFIKGPAELKKLYFKIFSINEFEEEGAKKPAKPLVSVGMVGKSERIGVTQENFKNLHPSSEDYLKFRGNLLHKLTESLLDDNSESKTELVTMINKCNDFKCQMNESYQKIGNLYYEMVKIKDSIAVSPVDIPTHDNLTGLKEQKDLCVIEKFFEACNNKVEAKKVADLRKSKFNGGCALESSIEMKRELEEDERKVVRLQMWINIGKGIKEISSIPIDTAENKREKIAHFKSILKFLDNEGEDEGLRQIEKRYFERDKELKQEEKMLVLKQILDETKVDLAQVENDPHLMNSYMSEITRNQIQEGNVAGAVETAKRLKEEEQRAINRRERFQEIEDKENEVINLITAIDASTGMSLKAQYKAKREAEIARIKQMRAERTDRENSLTKKIQSHVLNEIHPEYDAKRNPSKPANDAIGEEPEKVNKEDGDGEGEENEIDDDEENIE